MRARRYRNWAQSLASYQPPVSWLLLLALLLLVFIFRVLHIFTVVSYQCAYTAAIWLYALPGRIALIDLFIIAFWAMACLWFVNLVRTRRHRSRWGLRLFEALLIVFSLHAVHYWDSILRPYGFSAQFSPAIQRALGHTPFFFMDSVRIDEAYFRKGPDLDPDHLILQYGEDSWYRGWRAGFSIFGSDACSCWSPEEMRAMRELDGLSFDVRRGRLTEEGAAARVWEIDKPMDPEWCPAIIELSRRR
ncbi:hypothetical protein [Glycocaulis sp.]